MINKVKLLFDSYLPGTIDITQPVTFLFIRAINKMRQFSILINLQNQKSTPTNSSTRKFPAFLKHGDFFKKLSNLLTSLKF